MISYALLSRIKRRVVPLFRFTSYIGPLVSISPKTFGDDMREIFRYVNGVLPTTGSNHQPGSFCN
jgi:hypothetical protein